MPPKSLLNPTAHHRPLQLDHYPGIILNTKAPSHAGLTQKEVYVSTAVGVASTQTVWTHSTPLKKAHGSETFSLEGCF